MWCSWAGPSSSIVFWYGRIEEDLTAETDGAVWRWGVSLPSYQGSVGDELIRTVWGDGALILDKNSTASSSDGRLLLA